MAKVKGPGGRRFYGAVTVSSRGQMVLPVDARRDFNIETGDKLLVLGELGKGLWLCTPEQLLSVADGALAFLLDEV